MTQVCKFVRNSVEYPMTVLPDVSLEDETGATGWFPLYRGHSLAAGTAFFRCAGVNISGFAGVAGSRTPHVLVVADSTGKTITGFIAEADAAEALGSELLSNTGFESGGTGGDFNGGAEIDDGISDNFTFWVEANVNDGIGNKVEATATVHGGSVAAKLTRTTATTQLRGTVAVTAGKLYKLVLWTRGDGSVEGSIRFFDETNVAWITASIATGVPGVVYTEKTFYVVAPAGCASLTVYLFSPGSAGICYYDDVSLKEVTDVGADGVHIVSTPNGSTRNWAAITTGFNYNGTSYTFDIYRMGWHIDEEFIPKIATPKPGGLPDPVIEEFAITSMIPSAIPAAMKQDCLAAIKQWLDKLWADAARYVQDRTEPHPVWFHFKLDNETGERRALVRRVKQVGQSSHVAQGPRGGIIDAQEVLVLEVEREGLWERTALYQFPQAQTPGSSVVYSYDYTAAGAAISAHDILGSAPARIDYLDVRAALLDELGRIWIGIRSANKHGTLANFITSWELESGTNNPTESGITDQADATASAGNYVRVVETDLNWDDEWHEVLQILLNDVTANESDNYGNFLWLLRGLVTAGTWEVQIRHGYLTTPDANFIQGPIIEIDNTSWDIFEMDVARIPLRDLQANPLSVLGEDYDGFQAIQVWARRTAGAGNLWLDCLCPIPLDEGYAMSSGFDITSGSWIFTRSPQNTIQAHTYAGVGFDNFPPLSESSFSLPPGDGRMIMAFARASSSDLTDIMVISTSDEGYYAERWYTLRGGE